jgi:hypothetical protein
VVGDVAAARRPAIVTPRRAASSSSINTCPRSADWPSVITGGCSHRQHHRRVGVTGVDGLPVRSCNSHRVGVTDAAQPAPGDHPASSSPNSWSST